MRNKLYKILVAGFALALAFTSCMSMNSALMSQSQKEYDQEYERESLALAQKTFDSLRTLYERDTVVMVTFGDKAYKTVLIGIQVWMAENLDMKIGNSVCYENNEENCGRCGRLYDRETAMKACQSASGWSLPSESDYLALENAGIPRRFDVVENTITINRNREHSGVNKISSKATGTDLRAKSGWNNNGNGEDKYGFSALPCGAAYRNSDRISKDMGKTFFIDTTTRFSDYGSSASFWHIGYQVMNKAHYKELNSSSNRIEGQEGDVYSGFSVRCVKEYPQLEYKSKAALPRLKN